MEHVLEVNTDPAKSAFDTVQRSINHTYVASMPDGSLDVVLDGQLVARRGVFLYDDARRVLDARRERSTSEVYDLEALAGLEGVPFCSEPVELSSGYTATLRPIPDSSGTVTHEQVERRESAEVIAGALSLRRPRTVVPLSTLTGLMRCHAMRSIHPAMFEQDWPARREVVREPS